MDEKEKRLIDWIRSIANKPLREAVERYFKSCWNLFTKQPCSLGFHHTYTGGLLDHTIEVCEFGLKIIKALGLEVNWDHYIAAALLHDLGRVGYYEYNDETECWRETPEHINPEYPHSLKIVLDFPRKSVISLPKPVEYAILSHMGGWSDTGVYPNTILSSVLHTADLISSRVKRN